LSITTAILPLLVYFACFLSYIKLLASLLSVRLLSPILEIPCFLCYMAQTTHQQLATTISSRIMFSYEVSKLGRISNSIDVPHMEFPSISSPVEKKAQAFNFFANAIEPQLRLSPYNEVSPFLATSRVSFTPTHYLLLLLLPPLLPASLPLAIPAPEPLPYLLPRPDCYRFHASYRCSSARVTTFSLAATTKTTDYNYYNYRCSALQLSYFRIPTFASTTCTTACFASTHYSYACCLNFPTTISATKRQH
jgi:hypothetical protein